MNLGRNAILATSVVMLGASFAMPHRNFAANQDAKAEDVYKDIKSLKGQKASDVIPAMHFMTASLGVNCQFCHEQGNFAAPNQGKDSAREMIKLTKDINDKQFEGRQVITCNSCHDGHSHPAAAVSPLPVRAGLRADASVKVDELTEASSKANGYTGKPTILHFKGTTMLGGASHDVDVYQGSGGKFRVSVKGVYSMGCDGTVTWVNQGAKPYEIKSPDNEAILRGGAFFWASKIQPAQATGGKEKVEGTSFDVIRATFKDSPAPVKFYFDPSTHLVAKAVYFDKSIMGSMSDAFGYSDYKSVGGIMVPMTWTHYTAPGKSDVFKYTSAELGTGVADSIFGMSEG